MTREKKSWWDFEIKYEKKVLTFLVTFVIHSLVNLFYLSYLLLEGEISKVVSFLNWSKYFLH